MADHATGKDREVLARWIFVAMIAHPQLVDLSAVTEATREESDRDMASSFTRLIAETCAKEAASAIQAEGSRSFESAFEQFGKLAWPN